MPAGHSDDCLFLPIRGGSKRKRKARANILSSQQEIPSWPNFANNHFFAYLPVNLSPSRTPFPSKLGTGPEKKLKQEKVALKLNRHSLLITFVLFFPDFRPFHLGWPEKRARDLRPKGQKVQQQKTKNKKNTPTGMFPKPDTWKTITRHGKRTSEVKNVQSETKSGGRKIPSVVKRKHKHQ